MGQRENDPFYQGLSYAARIGIEMVSATLVGAGIGYFIDWKFKTVPWALIAGVLVGSAAGFLNIYRFVQAMEKKESEQDQKKE
ncbi:MAG TPA: AtpZ/AtpI family protein [Nitrospiria bacterium]|nr:AtpZ/AtpI family protein [Nitrospiria bacterium]